MSRRTLPLDDRLYGYLLEHSLREPDVLARLREETAGRERAEMQISPEQGQLMRLLVELLGARRALDVGTYTGYSAIAVALALPEDGRVVTCDVDGEVMDVARRYAAEAGVEAKIDFRLGPAVETLDELLAAGAAGRYEFAFLDADKESYHAYYERSLELLRPGGLVAVDNTLWEGKVADPEADDPDTRAIRAFNDHLHRDERVTLSLVPIGDGLTLARKRRGGLTRSPAPPSPSGRSRAPRQGSRPKPVGRAEGPLDARASW